MHLRPAVAIAAVAVMLAIGGPAQVATAATPDGESYPATVTLDSQQAKRFPDGSVFYPTGKISDQTLIIAPDVPKDVAANLAAQAKGSEVSAAASSCWTKFVAPLGSTWSRPYQSYCALIGKPGYNKTYAWLIQPAVNQQGCTQVLGYFTGYSGSVFGVWEKWYGAGCQSRGTMTPTYVTVPWGNVAAYPKLKAKSSIFTTAFMGNFM